MVEKRPNQSELCWAKGILVETYAHEARYDMIGKDLPSLACLQIQEKVFELLGCSADLRLFALCKRSGLGFACNDAAVAGCLLVGMPSFFPSIMLTGLQIIFYAASLNDWWK